MTQCIPSIIRVLVTVALFFPASGRAQDKAPELSFHTTKAWSLNKTAQHCSIETTFNNGFTMRFFGQKGSIELLNIDFAQDIFDRNTNYPVDLGVPGIKTLGLKSTPANTKALDISLLGQKDFFESLAQSSVMDLKIENNNFRFYMTGFSESANQLKTCINEQALADPQEKKSSKDYAVNEAKAQEEKLIKKEDTTNAVTKPLEKTQAQAQAQAEPIQISEPAIQEQAVPTKTPVAPGFIPKNAALTPEQLSAMAAQQTQDIQEPKPDSTPPLETLPVAQDVIENDVTRVEDNIHPPQAIPLAPEPEKHQTYSTPALKVTHNKFQAKADFRAEGIETASGHPELSSSDMARMAELESMVQKLKAENTALNNELKTIVNASEEERLSISSENWNLEQATMRFNEAERQIKRLGQDLQQERARCEAEKKDLESSLFDPQITEQQQLAKLASLEHELSEIKKENERLRKAQSRP